MRRRIKGIVALVFFGCLLIVLIVKIVSGVLPDPADELQRLLDEDAFSHYIGTTQMDQATIREKIEELEAFCVDELQEVEGTQYLYDGLDPDWCIHFKAFQPDPPMDVWGYRNTDLHSFPNLSEYGVPRSEDIDYYCMVFNDVEYSWGTIPAIRYCVFTKPDSEGLADVYYLSIQ